MMMMLPDSNRHTHTGTPNMKNAFLERGQLSPLSAHKTFSDAAAALYGPHASISRHSFASYLASFTSSLTELPFSFLLTAARSLACYDDDERTFSSSSSFLEIN
jgi:hypothetical protein